MGGLQKICDFFLCASLSTCLPVALNETSLCPHHVLRGGAWNRHLQYARAAFLGNGAPSSCPTMSRYISDTIRQLVAQRAGYRCGYCRVHQDDFYYQFEIDLMGQQGVILDFFPPPNFFPKILKRVWFFQSGVLTFAGAFEKGVSKLCLVGRGSKAEI